MGLTGIELPEAKEGFAIIPAGTTLVVWGKSPSGIMYALTELADRIQYKGSDGLRFDAPVIESPSIAVRSIARAFSCEASDKQWFYDKAGWRDYLSMLASNRYNRFALTLGMAYNYPYHHHMIRDVYLKFSYPFLVEVPGFPVRVAGLSADERALNLEMLAFIGREAARRGLAFQLGLWTQHYDFDMADKASHRIEGITNENLAPYCKEALALILKAVPEISGLTFRVHVEGGIEEGDYDFWKTLFEAVKESGRPIEIDMHAKGLDHEMIEVARASGMPVVVSPKYIAEHMGLPYHPASIREREYPPVESANVRETLSKGSRKFLRASYGDLLAKDRDWNVIFRIWPGTQRLLLWADPEMSSGYGRHASLCGAEGVELCEPMFFRGRMGTGVPGARFNYKTNFLSPKQDWHKYEYHYRVWGRRLFAPDTGLDDCRRFLEAKCGDAGRECEVGLAHASRILPLVTQTHGPSVSNNLYWPEMYTNLAVLGEGPNRPYGHDTDRPVRFGNVSSFDPQLFANAREYVGSIASAKDLRKYNPLDVAEWLEALARNVESQIPLIRSRQAFHTPDVQRIYIDLRILSGIARFFAEKYRASCWAEAFMVTGLAEAREKAGAHVRLATVAWKEVVDASKDVYQEDLSFGIQHYMRGHWAQRLHDIEKEALDLESWREGDDPSAPSPDESGKPYLDALKLWVPTLSRVLPVTYPEVFTAGQEILIQIECLQTEDAPVLHYRHVNQAERWNEIPMTAETGRYCARIPAEYTQSAFHLQFYVTALEGNTVVLSPGLEKTLSNQPYLTILQT